MALSHNARHYSGLLKPELISTAAWWRKGHRENCTTPLSIVHSFLAHAQCARKLCTVDKGVVSVQLCLERQLESGMFPLQVGRWNAREYWKKLPAGRYQAPRDDAQRIA